MMNTGRLPDFKRGMSFGDLSARQLQRLVDDVSISANITGSNGISVTRNGFGTNISFTPVREARVKVGNVRRFTVTAVFPYYLVCDDEYTGQTAINVAKPESAWPKPTRVRYGITVSYSSFDMTGTRATASSTSHAETVVIVEPYDIGQTIVAAPVLGGTTIAEAPDWWEIGTARVWTAVQP